MITPAEEQIKSDNKGLALEQDALYYTYASKCPEWHRNITHRLLRKARLGTLEEDLGMEGTDYNLATSILFVGYLLMQLLSNLLLTRIRPSLSLVSFRALISFHRGMISACQAAVQSSLDLLQYGSFLDFSKRLFS
ncbi:Major facilitator superfamily domain general substrate transporter [Penicillium vulpinum]|uniref:Major facilitator superfamily domain general substrate transporter n=1 Tax=Penicillium vulpinum TaxID=29845 RepID=UPI0025493589|nr:Major facilitator superfamily domain general substrate transporter [Penicillium vulpinum]KAJ5950133.1 Major facilitator superfamily domain general substrate transporter [Penicillium vulpinum]